MLNLGLNDTTAEARRSFKDSTPRLWGFIADSANELFVLGTERQHDVHQGLSASAGPFEVRVVVWLPEDLGWTPEFVALGCLSGRISGTVEATWGYFGGKLGCRFANFLGTSVSSPKENSLNSL